MDFLPGFGNSNAIKTDNTQRKLWQISDFNSVQVVSHEAGTPENSHPAVLSTETLQQVLNEAPTPVRQIRPEVSRDLEAICLKCLRKLPAERYASAAELADDLRTLRPGMPVLDCV